MTGTTLHAKADSELQQDVLAELRWEPSLDPARIAVTARDGIVTLAGTVPSYLERWAAEHAAKRVAGVRAVVNELEVRRPGDEEEITDEDIAASAARALKWNIFVPSDKVKVSVSRGWVKLDGEVRWQFQKVAAEDAVRLLCGVRGVTNRIRVTPRRLPDEEVKSKIEDALSRRLWPDAARIRVEAAGGTVTLRGTVGSWAEREEAERLAWAASGVHEVENLIAVEA